MYKIMYKKLEGLLQVCPGLYRRDVARNHVGSHPKAFPLQRCFKPLHAVLSILFARQSRQTIVLPSGLSLLILLTPQSFAYFLLIPVCDQPATILCPNAFLNRTSLISMETMSISVIGLRSGPRV